MSDRVFVDTNILVYAHDRQAGDKHLKARDLTKRLWRGSPAPVISIQVLHELYVNLTRKGVAHDEARECVEDYAHWELVTNTLPLLRFALNMVERWPLSLWDSLILAAARRAQVRTVWSEDMSAGQEYDGVTVINPL